MDKSTSSSVFNPHDSEIIDLTPEVIAGLLNAEGWAAILGTFAGTLRVAVALVDPKGILLGQCHNPQPVWQLIRPQLPDVPANCPFCLPSSPPCDAITEALRTGLPVTARDYSGLAHVAAPLVLRGHLVGALLAGQVFDRYPEPLPLQRVARDWPLSPQDLWHRASRQTPVSTATLRMHGDLLAALGQAFLRQQYAVILEKELTKVNYRYGLLIDNVKDYAFFTLDSTGQVTEWNRGAQALLGYSAKDIVGRHFSCLFAQYDSDFGPPGESLQRPILDGRPEREGWFVRKNGTRFFGTSGLSLLDHGERGHYVNVVHDITRRKDAEEERLHVQTQESIAALERRVAERTDELKKSNEELLHANSDLQQFAHSASHDLQEPLRTVAVYSELLKKSYEGKLDAQADEFLGYMADGARRMQMLVRDLLAYAQATNCNTPAALVDANAILSESLRSLKSVIQENNAVITFGELPFIQMHAVHLRQLFLNLLGNAVKYHHPGEFPIIHVSAARHGEKWTFSVSDNGIGINPQYALKIFGIFKRLHIGGKFSGTGIGLAICQKIVESYYGRIWVEPGVPKGSTFCFTLPAPMA